MKKILILSANPKNTNQLKRTKTIFPVGFNRLVLLAVEIGHLTQALESTIIKV